MKKIGTGFYYNVYDLGNGRVRKIPRSPFAQFLQLLRWYLLRPKLLVKELMKAPYTQVKVKEQYDVSQKVISIAPQYFGHTVFNGYECEQDVATPLGHLVHAVPQEKFIGYCADYARIVQELWKFGIGEKIFNFSLNAGVNTKGELVLLDTNEYTFDRAEAESKILSKRPLRASSYQRLPEELKPLVKELFEKEFTREKLEQYWNKNVS